MSNFNSNKLLRILQQIRVKSSDFVPLHEPSFEGNEWDYLKECLESGWVSSAGKFVDEFEARLAQYTGVPFAIATVNGTAALHLCLKLVGVQPKDEVLLPALTFVATANAIIYCDATPHFIDSEELTLGISPSKLRLYLKNIAEIKSGNCINRHTQQRIKALIVMHTFGHPVDLDPILEICQEYHLELIEDAAESLGSFYKSKHTGHWGKVTALSFNGNKIITTGGGGAILTSDATLAEKSKYLSTTAKIPHRWKYIHDQIGYNYRLPNLNAALGCAQMEQLPRFVKEKRRLAQKYQQLFTGVSGVRFFTEPPNACSNYWLNVLLLEKGNGSHHEELLTLTNDHGIMTRPAWELLNTLPMFQNFPKMDLSTAENLQQRLINIPSSSCLKINTTGAMKP